MVVITFFPAFYGFQRRNIGDKGAERNVGVEPLVISISLTNWSALVVAMESSPHDGHGNRSIKVVSSLC